MTTRSARPVSRVALGVLVLAIGLMASTVPASASSSVHHQRTPVLGKKHLFEPYGRGWGTYRPHKIFNGGDPSGLVVKIKWEHWGSGRATGHGVTSAFKPGGGYYSKPVKIRMRASQLGHCTTNGPRAYTQLHVSEQKRPGSSHYTKWFSWSGLKSICARTYRPSE